MAPAAGDQPLLVLPHLDPLALDLVAAVHGGDIDAVGALLDSHPGLATARMVGRSGVAGGWRTPLHVVTDWPGYFPAAPAVAALLIGEGADPDDDTGGERPETPLHWAASTDDVDVAAVLVAAGARVDVPGGSTGTTTHADLDHAFWQACHGGQRRAAERLLAAGADPTARPSHAPGTSALDAATGPDTRRSLLADWLRERGATPADLPPHS
ncbi:MAG TPA: ankyrin repeat domain-containing protein [Acidimicrobiales bacterium]|nr:ankyrin repeat domain-containing protein [Acidimicrobiales bacterium]